MSSSRVYPSRPKDVVNPDNDSLFGSQVTLTHNKQEDSRSCCTRRCILIEILLLFIFGAIAAAITCGIIFGIPPKQLITRQCKTTSDRNGFLCDDRTTCLMSTQICNGKVDCSNGEDEANLYCDNLPMSLPKNLVFLCSDQKSWTYIDKKCNGKNDCGDCSDESALQCPPCFGWKCTTVFFSDCDCIPKSRCKDHIQDCSDWSDENICI
ncbi:low-density lipoprotein receptor class A domain-containing protein 1-like [Callorhinchus milii]|uniref:low-density lipoprotein receptor class A domain-containing protein 1-like n=1 Tax=Callorhinchus milii TaxID=7868 RepID=UPI0004575529|nr:low-density lipoprotein receptor class A domain-containing protein 1-like [Callorhinchus milii]|eukprot:gi/632963646/ref/XP_007897997.1/ PREDICTED: low-density lipoprotein receptor class A domain-containing protein 1-like [Callorhinchus milii]